MKEKSLISSPKINHWRANWILSSTVLLFYLLCKGFEPVGTIRFSSKVLLSMFFPCMKKYRLTPSCDSFDEEIFFFSAPWTWNRKAFFCTASDPIHAKNKRLHRTAMTRTTNLISTSRSALYSKEFCKNKQNPERNKTQQRLYTWKATRETKEWGREGRTGCELYKKGWDLREVIDINCGTSDLRLRVWYINIWVAQNFQQTSFIAFQFHGT